MVEKKIIIKQWILIDRDGDWITLNTHAVNFINPTTKFIGNNNNPSSSTHYLLENIIHKPRSNEREIIFNFLVATTTFITVNLVISHCFYFLYYFFQFQLLFITHLFFFLYFFHFMKFSLQYI